MGRSLRCNWDAFWGAALKDHCHAGLIWNERTRSELREALQVLTRCAMHTSALLPRRAGLHAARSRFYWQRGLRCHPLCSAK